MMCWTADGSCGCLRVIVCVCECERVCVCVHVVNCGFLHPRFVCLCLRRRTRDCNRCGDALGVQRGFTYSHDPEFLLDYQQMEIRGEYADR